ncbi:MAG: hypothetical protein IT579_11710, partial [Verrucomicrobia subdivision 3 bacterium]|nr:hypothetical protein [Limisphaerales bacterium]
MKFIGLFKPGWNWLALAVVLASGGIRLNAEVGPPVTIENQYLKYIVAADGSNSAFIDKTSGTDYCDHQRSGKFASLKKAGKQYAATQATYADGKLQVQFGESAVTVVLGVGTEKRYFTFEVLSVSDAAVDELVFLNVPLTTQGSLADKFLACTLALNIKTDVSELPGPSRHLLAAGFARPGLVGAKAAILGCPQGVLRNVIKEAVSAAKDLPQTDRGGPWALDSLANRGSYLIDYPGSISETNVDKWIATAKGIGAKQIDFHTGHTLRFGDYEPDPAIYPKGLESLKAVIDRLRAAGIAAGLHTYAFYVAKNSKWVTPTPDPRLGKDATFTLAASLTETDKTVTVTETTQEMSTLTGFQVRNSVTLQIDDELITYTGINKEPPYAFTSCQRGAHGTKVVKHEAGAKVHHLKECFGLFTPDGDSTMFEEVADRTAEVYNKCGFDMIYLDALDGADILGRWPNGWKYYATKFVYRLSRSLKHPAIMEMSTFDHHLWFARSRVGAWDAPSKGYKRFIDQHFLENKSSQQNFLPANLGWWCVFDWSPKDRIRTFADDLEYIMCKAIAGDHSLSWLLGFEPETFEKSYNARRLGALVKQYEELRLTNYFPPAVREKLGASESDFTLEKTTAGQWQFRPVKYETHKVLALDGTSNRWMVENKYREQPLKVRIEALLSLSPYGGNGQVLAAFAASNEFSPVQAAAGVTGSLQSVSTPVKESAASGGFAAKSDKTNALCAWAMTEKKFTQPVNLLEKGFGVWIHGDGKGQVLNFQWRAPEHLSGGLSEHYAVVDFTGWRYFEFVEPESDRLMDYGWPYLYANPDSDFGSTERLKRFNRFTGTFWVDYGKLDSLKLWYNNLPKGEEVNCYLSPIKSLPHVKAKLVNPAIEIGGQTITFPTTLASGSYLEFRSMTDCKAYDAKGELIGDIKPQGEIPKLKVGTNAV